MPSSYRSSSSRRAAASMDRRPCSASTLRIVSVVTSARQHLEHLVGVAVGAHVEPSALDPPIWTHEKRRPDDSHALPPVKRLLAPSAVALHDLVSRVAQQGDPESVLRPEFLVRRASVGRDAEYLHAQFRVLIDEIAELAGLLGATRRVVSRVEVDDDAATREIPER